MDLGRVGVVSTSSTCRIQSEAASGGMEAWALEKAGKCFDTTHWDVATWGLLNNKQQVDICCSCLQFRKLGWSYPHHNTNKSDT